MKKYAVYVTINNKDRRIGTVHAFDKSHAMSMISDHHKKSGQVYLIPIMIEA